MFRTEHENTEVQPNRPPKLSPSSTNFNDDLVGKSPTRLSEALATASEVAAGYLAEDRNPCSKNSPEALGEKIDQTDLDSPLGSLQDSMTELRELWLDHAIWYHNPRYIAHLNCPISATAVAGDVLASAVNTAVESWDQASSAALIEQKILTWLCNSLHWEQPGIHGVFTSGGTQSNLQALLIARAKAIEAHGYASLPRLCILHTEATHYSVARAAHTLGLHPTIGCREVPTGKDHRMSPAALKQTIVGCRNSGLIPIAIVSTAGTTDLGAIDPLSRIADIAHQNNIHLHVDAAYGGVLLTSPTQRHRLDGIELADSVSIDFHKTFFQPVACSALLLHNIEDLKQISWHADYLNPSSSSALNLADYSLQTTRRFDALKLWLVLRTHGAQTIGEAFDACCEKANQVAAQVANHPLFELHSQPQLSTVVFRVTHPDAISAQQLKQNLFSAGEAVIATTSIDGQSWLKFTILDPTLSVADTEQLLDLIAHHSLTTQNQNPTEVPNYV